MYQDESAKAVKRPPPKPAGERSFRCGDIEAVFRRSPEGIVELVLLPLKGPPRADSRRTLEGTFEFNLLDTKEFPSAASPSSVIHIKFAGTGFPGGFAAGKSLLNSPDTRSIVFSGQRKIPCQGGFTVITKFSCPAWENLSLEHLLVYRRGETGVRTSTRITNRGSKLVELDMLTSFSLGGITPYHRDFAPGRLFLHRFRSWWSAEGRWECERLEDLGLERAWSNWGNTPTRVEKFGQVGSMPVRGFFPTALIEDRGAGVFWGVQLAHPGSWQIEAIRCDDRVMLCGGQADFDFGHWRKHIQPGDIWTTPEALLTVGTEGVDNICQRLTTMQAASLVKRRHRIERSLPVVCNDWCAHWSDTTHDKVVNMARSLRNTGVKYLVIDDGWQLRKTNTGQHNGDWDVDPRRFRNLKETCMAIRREGLIPGIWFEFETISPGNRTWEDATAHQLHRDGVPLQVGNKRFWDFRDPWVHRYLRRKVIRLISKCGFGYLKVDYNESIGLGVDGSESLGEGLRSHLAAVQNFFLSIRKELPGVVIENCSSGGHRLEPSMMALADMASFSDAHECQEIPILAANVLRLIPARMSQIWAVLHRLDSDRRTVYSLAAGFLGRLCLSGEISSLSPPQMETVRHAIRIYDLVAPVIRDGAFRLFQHHNAIYRAPEGWQAVVTTSARHGRTLVVFHVFDSPPSIANAPLPPGLWRIETTLHSGTAPRVALRKQSLEWNAPAPFSALVCVLQNVGA